MCIICVKPSGMNMPDIQTIHTMWQGNSDGAGLAYWRLGDTAVTIDKGYMKLKKLKERLAELSLGKDDLAVLHFRYATHGATDAGNCHPFPLSSKIEALRAISGQFPCAIAHNGVFGGMPCHNVLSDSQKFIAKILANSAIVDNLDNPAIGALIEGYCGNSSKLAILKPGKLILVGEYDTDKGLLYSNRGYKTYKQHDFCNTGTQCGLCKDSATVLTFVEEFDVFMCGKCADYNLGRIKAFNETGRDIL